MSDEIADATRYRDAGLLDEQRISDFRDVRGCRRDRHLLADDGGHVACSEMACNDDASFVSAQSRIIVPLAAGQRVLIVVDGRGDFVLNVNDVTTPSCGNGFVENSEECDGKDFGGQDCFQATGGSLPGGFLTCLSDCSLDVSNCTGGSVDGGIGGIGGFGGFGGFAGSGAFGGRIGVGGIIIGAGGIIIGPPPPPIGPSP